MKSQKISIVIIICPFGVIIVCRSGKKDDIIPLEQPIDVLKSMFLHIGMIKNYLMNHPFPQIRRTAQRLFIPYSGRMPLFIFRRNIVSQHPISFRSFVITDGEFFTSTRKLNKIPVRVKGSGLAILRDPYYGCLLLNSRGNIHTQYIHYIAIRVYRSDSQS